MVTITFPDRETEKRAPAFPFGRFSGRPLVTNDGFMKKSNHKSRDDVRPEYDFASMKGGVRGKYVRQYRAGSNLVLLDPEVARAFPTDDAVNETLRAVLKMLHGVPARRPKKS